jgi:hypothetical protein
MILGADIQGVFKMIYGLVEITTVLRPAVSCEKNMSGVRP